MASNSCATSRKALGQSTGSGFSISALQYMRAFFLTYPDLLNIHHALRGEFDTPTEQREWKPGWLHTDLSWTTLSRLAQGRKT